MARAAASAARMTIIASAPSRLIPVALRPGRLRLAASPCVTGSPPIDGNCRGRARRGQSCGLSPDRREHAHGTADKLRCHRRNPIILAECPSVLDGYVLALDKSAVAQATPERIHEVSGVLGRPGTEVSVCRQRRRLGCHWSGARERGASQESKKFAPLHRREASVARAARRESRPRPRLAKLICTWPLRRAVGYGTRTSLRGK